MPDDYHFTLDKTSVNPVLEIENAEFDVLLLWFWFKTFQEVTYFFSVIPNDPLNETLAIWKVNSTIYVKLWQDEGYV